MDRTLAEQLQFLHADAFGWALHCCGGDWQRAEDVIQNAYVKTVAGRVIHQERSSLKTWWFGVIRLTALEEIRRQRLREGLSGKLLSYLGGQVQDLPPSPARMAELSEQNLQLKKALASLPARQAEVLHLVFYQDLSLSEAASVMKISLGSVRQHYERGKTRLRQLIQFPPSES